MILNLSFNPEYLRRAFDAWNGALKQRQNTQRNADAYTKNDAYYNWLLNCNERAREAREFIEECAECISSEQLQQLIGYRYMNLENVAKFKIGQTVAITGTRVTGVICEIHIAAGVVGYCLEGHGPRIYAEGDLTAA